MQGEQLHSRGNKLEAVKTANPSLSKHAERPFQCGKEVCVGEGSCWESSTEALYLLTQGLVLNPERTDWLGCVVGCAQWSSSLHLPSGRVRDS